QRSRRATVSRRARRPAQLSGNVSTLHYQPRQLLAGQRSLERDIRQKGRSLNDTTGDFLSVRPFSCPEFWDENVDSAFEIIRPILRRPGGHAWGDGLAVVCAARPRAGAAAAADDAARFSPSCRPAHDLNRDRYSA